MKTIFVVTSGRYSDYGINAMFTTQEKAQQYINRRIGIEGSYFSDAHIEEWELDSVNNDWLKGKVDCWVVWMKLDTADVISAEIYDGEPQVAIDVLNHLPGQIRIMLLARNREHAVKVAMERRSIFLAGMPPQN